MTDDPDRTHSDIPTPNGPPDDTELIAYLDGELDPATAKRVEARLARDPAARAAVEAYAKSFDLLDYLPKPEPSPDFTARTVTRLRPVTAREAARAMAAESRPRRRWVEAAAWGGVAALALVLGFVGHSVARPLLSPSPVNEEPSLADLEVIERLPLYVGVDDLAFLTQVDAADLFAEDGPAAPTPADPLPAEDRGPLIAQFRGLPVARQQQLRALHKELKEVDAKDAKALLATLHAYAAWLDRLPDTERKRVLAAPGPAERLTEIRQVKEAQWRATLAPRQKELLRNVTSTQDREHLAAEFRRQESQRRGEWEWAHRQWQLVSEKGQRPWPFDDPKRADQVEAYIRGPLGADLSGSPPNRGGGSDPQPHCRLTPQQFAELKGCQEAARKDGGWAWMQYGACLLRLSDAHPTFPLPRDGRAATTVDTLPKEYKPFFQLMKLPGFDLSGKGGSKGDRGWLAHLGRWPEFALNVHDRRLKGFGPMPQLGPCRPDEFADEVTAFVKEQLVPKLSPADAAALRATEGKWPEYPRKLLELSRAADLGIPGVTLPGPPSQWDRLYRLPSGKR